MLPELFSPSRQHQLDKNNGVIPPSRLERDIHTHFPRDSQKILNSKSDTILIIVVSGISRILEPLPLQSSSISTTVKNSSSPSKNNKSLLKNSFLILDLPSNLDLLNSKLNLIDSNKKNFNI